MGKTILPVVIVLLLLGTSACAEITEVMLFPNGALITETATLQMDHRQGTFFLPASAAPDSLQITPQEKSKILNFQVESIVMPATDLSQLEKQLNDQKAARQKLQDEQTISRLGLDYWNNQRTQQLSNSKDIEALGQMIITATTPLVKEVSRLELELKNIDAEILELEQQLARRKGNSQRLWQVTVQTEESASAKLPVQYRYRISAARWESHYTLEALPAADQVNWLWQGRLQQASGKDWNNILLSIATAEPHITPAPPALSPWVIRERQIRPLPATRNMMQKPAVVMDEAVIAMAPAEASSTRTEGEIFDLYSLGRQTIKAGETSTLTIANGTWPAHFSYLLRPHFSASAFLHAEISTEDQPPLPSGSASLLVDGVLIGKQTFSLHAKSAKLSFGSDPGIACKVKREDLSDRNGLFSKNRSLAWKMEVSATNNKKHGILLRVEDAYPRVADKRIELTELDLPGNREGAQKDRLISWQYQVAPGQVQRLEYGYRINYPEEMQVDTGR